MVAPAKITPIEALTVSKQAWHHPVPVPEAVAVPEAVLEAMNSNRKRTGNGEFETRDAENNARQNGSRRN